MNIIQLNTVSPSFFIDIRQVMLLARSC